MVLPIWNYMMHNSTTYKLTPPAVEIQVAKNNKSLQNTQCIVPK